MVTLWVVLMRKGQQGEDTAVSSERCLDEVKERVERDDRIIAVQMMGAPRVWWWNGDACKAHP